MPSIDQNTLRSLFKNGAATQVFGQEQQEPVPSAAANKNTAIKIVDHYAYAKAEMALGDSGPRKLLSAAGHTLLGLWNDLMGVGVALKSALALFSTDVYIADPPAATRASAEGLPSSDDQKI